MNDADILLVEDNHGDARMIELAFENQAIPGAVHAVKTGDEALDWLYRRGDFPEAPRPEIILLDLNLPATDGHVVLEEIKSDPHLKRIPVIILTSSQSKDDLIKAYEEYANACLSKPVNPDEYMNLIRAVADFWLSTAELPPISDGADDRQQ